MSMNFPNFVGLDPVAAGVWNQYSYDMMQRQKRFMRAWEYYKGQFKPPLKLIRMPDGTTINDNVYANYCRPMVDKSIDFLFGKGVQFQINDETTTEEESYLEMVWKLNNQERTLRKMAQNGAVCGHVFVRIVPDQLGDSKEFPRLIVHNPQDVYVEFNPHDVEQVDRYIVQYNAYDPDSKKLQTWRITIEPTDKNRNGWVVREEVAENSATTGMNGYTYNPAAPKWRLISTTDWPYSFSPMIDCQNLPAANEFWGSSDIEEDVLDLQDSINFVYSNIARILRYHAHPKTWGSGFNPAQVKAAVGEVMTLPKDAKLQNLEMQSDLASSLNYLKVLETAFFTVARTPQMTVTALENVPSNLSGIAIALMNQPLIDKTEQKRATYGEMLVELCNRLLVIALYDRQEELKLVWPDMLQQNISEETTTIQQQIANKLISRFTARKKLGHDPEKEDKRIKEDTEEDMALLKQQTAIQTDAEIRKINAQAKVQQQSDAAKMDKQAEVQKDTLGHQNDMSLENQAQQSDLAHQQAQKEADLGVQTHAVTTAIDTEAQKALAEHASKLRINEGAIQAKQNMQMQVQQARLAPKTKPKPKTS